jgi:hypothetical protein
LQSMAITDRDVAAIGPALTTAAIRRNLVKIGLNSVLPC